MASYLSKGGCRGFPRSAGEMVPHETVEANKVQEALELPATGERLLTVVGVPDQGQRRGARAALDHRHQCRRRSPGEGLSELAGLPNLWVPRTIKRVESPCPSSGSGKLDLKGCKDLALAKRRRCRVMNAAARSKDGRDHLATRGESLHKSLTQSPSVAG